MKKGEMMDIIDEDDFFDWHRDEYGSLLHSDIPAYKKKIREINWQIKKCNRGDIKVEERDMKIDNILHKEQINPIHARIKDRLRRYLEGVVKEENDVR